MVVRCIDVRGFCWIVLFVFLVVGGAVVSVSVADNPAAAHGFATHLVADNQTHTYASTEGTQFWYDAMAGFVNGRMTDQWDAKTEIETVAVSYNQGVTDAYWYVTPDISGGADTLCVNFTGAQHAGVPVCDSSRMRFAEDWVSGQSGDQKNQGACHEIGHTLGFDDSQPEYRTGCMSGGPNGTLSSHEKTHVNDMYDPY